MNEWISVWSNLPKHNQPVLIYVTHAARANGWGDKPMQTHVAQFQKIKVSDENPVPYQWCGLAGDWLGQDVTHWMELPTKPRTNTR